jgi:D-3-phosphoglycerate dehydrogenase
MDHRITGGERVPSIDALSGSLLRATVGLIGMGDTAYEFAKMLAPFQCRIIAYSPTSPKDRWTSPDDRYPHVVEHERAESLEEMLKQVDLLSLHCPLTPSTRHMLGVKEFKAMKPSAVVVNCARGGILDEAALAQALKRGELAGAGLDVFATEPAYGDNLGELGKMNNVICLPHLYVPTQTFGLADYQSGINRAGAI